MNLLSYQLFDHCSVEYDSPSSEPMALSETFEVSVTGVSPSTGLPLIDNSCIDFGVNPFGESIDVGVSDVLDTSCSLMEITGTCFGDSSNSSIENDSSSSGFMLIEEHFVTFDDEHGACSWGDEIDMSMNAEF